MSKHLNAKIEWAIKEEVRCAVQELVALGIDRDLALAVLEQVLPENEIYNIQDEEEEEDCHG